MAIRPLRSFQYMTFDVVGTLIDFEAGLVNALAGIAREQNVPFDAEEALTRYRAARTMPDALRFPDDLARVYGVIAPTLGLAPDPGLGERLRDSVAAWEPFPDSVAALARLKRHYKLIAMTNAQRWAFQYFDTALAHAFFAAFTTDDTGTEKPDPAFFRAVFDFVAAEGASRDDIVHVAQSQYHDIGVSRALGMTNCWIERRHDREGYGGTIAPAALTRPDYHFTSLAALADAVEAEFV